MLEAVFLLNIPKCRETLLSEQQNKQTDREVQAGLTVLELEGGSG